MHSNLTELESIILKMLIEKSIKNDKTDSLPEAKVEQIPEGEEERLKWIEDHLGTNDV